MIALAYKYGQLGNRLAYLKAFLSLAIEYDLKLLVFSFDEYARYFIGTSQCLLCGYPPHKGFFPFNRHLSRILYFAIRWMSWLCHPLQRFRFFLSLRPDANGCFLFTGENVEILKREKIVFFTSGWPCIPSEILEKNAEKVRAYFSLTDEYKAIVERFVAIARDSSDILVGIHIRQGDYQEWNDGQCYFETSVYTRLMREIVKKNFGKKVVFIVCTNEMQDWTLFTEFSYFIGPGNAIVDMYSLAECDEIYGPQSSFSWWASFYGQCPLYYIKDADDFTFVSSDVKV